MQGDWGTQFGMLIQNIAETREGGLAGTTVEDVADLQTLYRKSKERFDLDEEFKARARHSVTKLQGGNELYVQVLHMYRIPPFPLLHSPQHLTAHPCSHKTRQSVT